jgi:hypothetical protein
MDTSVIFTTDPEDAPIRLCIKQKDNLFEVYAEIHNTIDLNQAQQKHLATYTALEEAKNFTKQKRYLFTKPLLLE